MLPSPPPHFIKFLTSTGLLKTADNPRFFPLEGGVSSDIWRVDLKAQSICVKSALSKLKVASDWYAPIERNAFEVRWMETANQIVPGSTPTVLASNEASGMFAMDYLEPAIFPNWKDELRVGRADPAFAAEIGRIIAKIHRDTANDPDVATRFQTDDIFHAIRLEPYLEATANARPEVSGPLMALSKTTASHKTALVHGDVSPKNILVGADGPKFLDAECAWYGDPAFDLAFCLNHLMLKCLWAPDFKEAFLTCFTSMSEAYFANAEAGLKDIERRTAHLLPGLFLGRVDGKSPVEYLTDTNDKNKVRRVATELLLNPVENLSDIQQAWGREIGN